MLLGGREIWIKQQMLGKWRREKGGSRPQLLLIVSVRVCSQTGRGLLIIVKHFFFNLESGFSRCGIYFWCVVLFVDFWFVCIFPPEEMETVECYHLFLLIFGPFD